MLPQKHVYCAVENLQQRGRDSSNIQVWYIIRNMEHDSGMVMFGARIEGMLDTSGLSRVDMECLCRVRFSRSMHEILPTSQINNVMHVPGWGQIKLLDL